MNSQCIYFIHTGVQPYHYTIQLWASVDISVFTPYSTSELLNMFCSQRYMSFTTVVRNDTTDRTQTACMGILTSIAYYDPWGICQMSIVRGSYTLEYGKPVISSWLSNPGSQPTTRSTSAGWNPLWERSWQWRMHCQHGKLSWAIVCTTTIVSPSLEGNPRSWPCD